ncbi:hypothetical protein ES703_93218 [subsurface metagenome]
MEKEDIWLSEEELLREAELFAPHKLNSALLKGRDTGLRSLTGLVLLNDPERTMPASC